MGNIFDKPTWSKEVALEIIQSGFARMAKKYHPDVGGTPEQLLTLTATKEHLEKFIAGGRVESMGDSYTYTRAREEPRRPYSTYRNTRSQYWDQADRSKDKDQFTGEVPLEEFLDDLDYVQLKDVVIAGVTEKAFKIKIPGVKNTQWLPKSQIHEGFFAIYDPVVGDVVHVAFTKWIARQKGWMK